MPYAAFKRRRINNECSLKPVCGATAAQHIDRALTKSIVWNSEKCVFARQTANMHNVLRFVYLSLAATMLEQWTCICRKGQVPCVWSPQSLLFRLVQYVHFLTFFFRVNANGANELFVCSLLSHMHFWRSSSSSESYVLTRSAKDFLSLHSNAIILSKFSIKWTTCHQHRNKIFWFASGVNHSNGNNAMQRSETDETSVLHFWVNRVYSLHSFFSVDCMRAKRKRIISTIASSSSFSPYEISSLLILFLIRLVFFIETIYQTRDNFEQCFRTERGNKPKKKEIWTEDEAKLWPMANVLH